MLALTYPKLLLLSLSLPFVLGGEQPSFTNSDGIRTGTPPPLKAGERHIQISVRRLPDDDKRSDLNSNIQLKFRIVEGDLPRRWHQYQKTTLLINEQNTVTGGADPLGEEVDKLIYVDDLGVQTECVVKVNKSVPWDEKSNVAKFEFQTGPSYLWPCGPSKDQEWAIMVCNAPKPATCSPSEWGL